MPPCEDCCGAVITEFSVTVSGVVNNNCSDCDALNSTFLLDPADPDMPDCADFIYTRTDDCVEGNEITGGISGGSVVVGFQNGAAAPTTSGWAANHNGCCCGEHSMTNISGITDECDFSGATVTVNITCEEDICCTVSACECDDIPYTLYVRRSSDDSLIAEIIYDGSRWTSGPPTNYEFWCDPGAPDDWQLIESGIPYPNTLGSVSCTGTIALFTGTAEGEVYVSDS